MKEWVSQPPIETAVPTPIGWSRRFLGLLKKDPAKHSVSRLGFHISAPADQERADTVIGSFFQGYNTALTASDDLEIQGTCEGLEAIWRPFCYEGAALGCYIRSRFRLDSVRSDELLTRLSSWHPDYAPLFALGIGFGCGIMPGVGIRRTQSFLRDLSSEYYYLAYDGYGFQIGLFQFLKNPSVANRFLRFSDPLAVHSCFQGLGRSLRFIYLDEPDLLSRRIGAIDSRYHGDCHAGLGLAMAFTLPDRFEDALDYRQVLKPAAHLDFSLGLALGLYARRRSHSEFLEDEMQALESRCPSAAKRARLFLELCDRSEEQQDSSLPDSYPLWRVRLREELASLEDLRQ